jgi:hypothetical protein
MIVVLPSLSGTAPGVHLLPPRSQPVRCAGRKEGWVFQSRYKGKHIGAAFVNRQWVKARKKAGLPHNLVLLLRPA